MKTVLSAALARPYNAGIGATLNLVAIVVSLSTIGCEKSFESNRRLIVADKYVLEEVFHDKTNSIREIELRLVHDDREMPVSRLFVHHDRIITLYPTPKQSDSVRPVGNYQAIGSGWKETTELFLRDSRLIDASPYDVIRYPHAKTKEIRVEQFVIAQEDQLLPWIYLTVEQGTPYTEFLRVFEPLARCSDKIGLGYFAETDM